MICANMRFSCLRNLVIVFAVVLLVAVGSTAVRGEGECSTIECKIVDKAKLPRERLAEATAAKAMMILDAGLIREAAGMLPENPTYWYLTALMRTSTLPEPALYPDCRALLERALAADPDYLPALYAYATTKPTHEQRMQALVDLAERDSENAKPYYVMAIAQFKHLGENRNIIPESMGLAYPMDSTEWATVLHWIREGNKRPSFSAHTVKAPSTSDIKVWANGTAWPEEIVRKFIESNIDTCGWGMELGNAPQGFGFAPSARGLARQAWWEAKTAADNGHPNYALDMLHTVRVFADRQAHSEPEHIISFLVAKTVRDIAAKPELEIARDIEDAERVQLLEKESRIWEDAASKLPKSFEQWYVTLPAAPPQATDCWEYKDLAAEQEAMKNLLKNVRVFP